MNVQGLARAINDTPWAIVPSRLQELVARIETAARTGGMPEPEVVLRPTAYEVSMGAGCADGAEAGAGPGGAKVDGVDGVDAGHGPRAADGNGQRGGVIAVLPVQGVIEQKDSLFLRVFGGTSTEALSRELRAAVADPNVRAVVLDIDSPGGSVYGVQELAAEIRAARARKPIIAVAAPMAASAAYHIASQATELVVQPSGEVGSIGVFTMHVDVTQAAADAGWKVTIVQAGEHKTELSSFNALSDEAQAYLQGRVDDYYNVMTADIAKGRGVGVKAVRGEAWGLGRMLGARDAVREGLADRAGTLAETLGRVASGKLPQAKATAEDAEPAFVCWEDGSIPKDARVAEAVRELVDGCIAAVRAPEVDAVDGVDAGAGPERRRSIAIERRRLELQRSR